MVTLVLKENVHENNKLHFQNKCGSCLTSIDCFSFYLCLELDLTMKDDNTKKMLMSGNSTSSVFIDSFGCRLIPQVMLIFICVINLNNPTFFKKRREENILGEK